MVNMIGFHHKEPVYNTAGPGEGGFYIEVVAKPTALHPLRARVYTPTAYATWDSPEQAKLWADLPGSMPVMVDAYLKWVADQ